MSVSISSIDANVDTFANWVSITNQMAQTFSNGVVTANTTEGITGNSTVNLSAKLWGTMAANTFKVGNTISSNVTTANVAIEANLEVKSGFNLYTVGALSVKGDIIIDTTTKLRFADRGTVYSGTTGWLKANSTGYATFSNLSVKGSDLDPSEFLLTSNVGYANSTNSTFDVICYDESPNKWVRTTLKHLGTLEVDNLTLGLVKANNAVGEIRINGNTNFGGSSVALFVSNTDNRVGVKTTTPQAPLHVVGAIYATGDVTAFYTSDERLKDNFEFIPDALNKVRWINGYTFNWNKEKLATLDNVSPKPDTDVGVSAQQIKQVLPQAVIEREDGYMAVDYGKIVPLLIEAIKELSHKVSILEAEVEEKYRMSDR